MDKFIKISKEEFEKARSTRKESENYKVMEGMKIGECMKREFADSHKAKNGWLAVHQMIKRKNDNRFVVIKRGNVVYINRVK